MALTILTPVVRFLINGIAQCIYRDHHRLEYAIEEPRHFDGFHIVVSSTSAILRYVSSKEVYPQGFHASVFSLYLYSEQ